MTASPSLPDRLSRLARDARAAVVRAARALRAPVIEGELVEDDEDAWTRTPLPVYRAQTSTATLASRGGKGALVELPVRTVGEWTPAMVRMALSDADSGSLATAADLVEAIMGDDRVQGVLSTRTHGLLGLPLTFWGGRRQVKALEGVKAQTGAKAVPGDWWKMFPEPEVAQFLAWGILLGVALGERVEGEREIGERSTPRLKVWHPRWLRFDFTSQKWKLQTTEGEIEITPGDGQWILFTPYGVNRPWTQGAWRPIAFAWVLKQFALHDRARHSEVQGSAARIGIAPEGASEASRKGFLKSLRAMGRDNAFIMPPGYDYKVVEATGRTWEIYGAQIEWADRAIAITIAGQFVTTEGTKGFSNGQIHAAIKQDLIEFTAEALVTTLHEQGLRPWAADNWGDPELAPHAHFETDPPEDRLTKAQSIGALGDAVAKLDAALLASGQRVDAYELAGSFGVPMVSREGSAPSPPTPPGAEPSPTSPAPPDPPSGEPAPAPPPAEAA